jgi:hypothetical protein
MNFGTTTEKHRRTRKPNRGLTTKKLGRTRKPPKNLEEQEN